MWVWDIFRASFFFFQGSRVTLSDGYFFLFSWSDSKTTHLTAEATSWHSALIPTHIGAASSNECRRHANQICVERRLEGLLSSSLNVHHTVFLPFVSLYHSTLRWHPSSPHCCPCFRRNVRVPHDCLWRFVTVNSWRYHPSGRTRFWTIHFSQVADTSMLVLVPVKTANSDPSIGIFSVFYKKKKQTMNRHVNQLS